MTKSVYTGKDSIIIDGIEFKDLANGKVVTISYNEDKAKQEAGKNGTVITTYSANGQLGTMEVRAVRGGDLDIYLSSKYSEFDEDPAGYVAMSGSLVKKLGDGKGNKTTDSTDFFDAVIKRAPNTEEDVSGDIEQTVAVYSVSIGLLKRTIG